MNIFRRLFKYILAQKAKVAAGLVFTFLLAGGEVVTGAVLKILTDSIGNITEYFQNGKEGVLQIPIKLKIPFLHLKSVRTTLSGHDEVFKGILILCGVFIGLYILQAVFDYARSVFMGAAAQRIMQKIKNDIYGKIVRLPASFFDSNKTGDTVSRVTYDVMTLKEIVDLLIEVGRSATYCLVFIPVMFWLNWKITIFLLLFFPVSLIIISIVSKRIAKVSRHITDNVGNYTAFLDKRINAFKTVKAFGREKKEEAAYRNLMEENYRFNLRMLLLSSALKPSNELLGMAGVAGLLCFFSWELVYGSMTLGNTVFFLWLVKSAYKPFKKVAQAIGEMQLALVCSGKIFSLLDEKEEQFAGAPSATLPVNSLECRNLKFTYPNGTKVFESFSLSTQKGDIVAIKGPSGTGKTTLLYLFLRFYLPEKGTILIDNSDIATIPLHQLRHITAIAGADIPLFPGTIRENLLYGGSVTGHDAVNRYLPFLGIDQAELDSSVGEGEICLSAGQRQKIGIVRALLTKPKILLLDEVCGSIDNDSIDCLFSLIAEADISLVFIVTRRKIITSRATKIIELCP